MKATCKCGHKVTINVSPEQDRKWEEYAKKCMCAECYTKMTGKVCGKDTVMVNDITVAMQPVIQ
jgi:hypothetical protein